MKDYNYTDQWDLLVGDDTNSQLLDTRPNLFPVVEEAVLMLRMFGHVEESLRELCLCQERIICLLSDTNNLCSLGGGLP